MRASSSLKLACVAASFVFAACGSSGSSKTTATSQTTSTAVSMIRGTVTSTSPLTVSGTALDTTSAEIWIDGKQGSADDLAVGQIVTVRTDDHGKAEKVEAEHVISGTVTGKDDGVIKVGDQTIAVSDDTVFAHAGGEDGIPEGHHVDVSGFSNDDGTVHATRVDDHPEGAEDEGFEAKGFVQSLATDPVPTFALALSPTATPSFTVTLAEGVSLPAGLANGSRIEMHAAQAPANGAVVATRITLEDDGMAEHEGSVELEGVVTSGDATSFTLAGQQVTTDASTRLVGGTSDDLGPGARLEVEGNRDATGVVLARKITLKSVVRVKATPSALVTTNDRTGTFTLLGIPVRVSSETRLPSANGQTLGLAALAAYPVEVRGYMSQSGTELVALRIDSKSDTRILVRAVVTAKDAAAGTLTMLGITVKVSLAKVSPAATLPADHGADDGSSSGGSSSGGSSGGSSSGGDSSGSSDGGVVSAATFDAIVLGETVVQARAAGSAAFDGTTLTVSELEIDSAQ